MATDTRLKIAPMFRKYLRPKADTPDLIAKLPPELRNHIYELAMANSTYLFEVKQGKRKRTVEREHNAWHEPPLLKTSKQIRSEAAPIFYKSFRFRMMNALNGEVSPIYISKIRSVVQWCGPKPFKEVIINIRKGAWEKLGEFLPFLELIRTSGFEPAVQEYKPDTLPDLVFSASKATSRSSVFEMASSGYANLQKVLEQALAMGRRARDEDWTHEKLAGQFAQWKKKALGTRGQEGKRKKI